MDLNQNIREALATLDAGDDSHWTAAGLPSMACVQSLLGPDVTRAQVSAAVPGFTRETATMLGAPGEGPGEPEAPIEEPPADESEMGDPPPAEGTPPPAAVVSLTEKVIEVRRRDLGAVRAKIAAQISEAAADLGRVDEAIAACDAQLEALHPPMTAQERYRQVVERSNAERRARAEENAERARLSPPSVRSKLDQAMCSSNRRGFGLQRPKYPTGGAA